MSNFLDVEQIKFKIMKNLKKIKLNNLSKSNITEREMSALQGGNYCYWSPENRDANTSANVCSCNCSGDYYGASGVNYAASFYKSTTGWGY